MKYTINVTQDDIINGTKNTVFSCAITRAVRRCTPFKSAIMIVNSISLTGIGDKSESEIMVPDYVTEWRSNFDDGQPVSPISFDIEAPD